MDYALAHYAGRTQIDGLRRHAHLGGPAGRDCDEASWLRVVVGTEIEEETAVLAANLREHVELRQKVDLGSGQLLACQKDLEIAVPAQHTAGDRMAVE